MPEAAVDVRTFLSFRASKPLIEAIARAAAAEGISLSDVIRRAAKRDPAVMAAANGGADGDER